MGKGIVCAAVAAAVVAGQRLGAQETSEGKVGRYQVVATGPSVILLDTATGRVWSRNFQGEWRDEGNPTQTASPTPPRVAAATGTLKKPTPTLTLPSKSVEMLVVQRENRAVPGSDGTVRVRLGDVTDGQVFLEVFADDRPLLPRTSVRQGDAAEFTLNGKRYALRVVEIRNILFGDDWAKLTIELADGADDPPPKKKGKKKRPDPRPPVPTESVKNPPMPETKKDAKPAKDPRPDVKPGK